MRPKIPYHLNLMFRRSTVARLNGAKALWLHARPALSFAVTINLLACNQLLGLERARSRLDCDGGRCNLLPDAIPTAIDTKTGSQPEGPFDAGSSTPASTSSNTDAGPTHDGGNQAWSNDVECIDSECPLSVRPRCTDSQTTACGGDPRGTWSVAGLCSLAELSRLVGGTTTDDTTSCAANYHWAERRAAGVLHILEDGSISTTIQVATDMEADLPESCLVSAIPSADVCAAKATRLARESLITEAVCQPHGTACRCLIVAIPEGWFNAAAIKRSIRDGAFCVDDSRLRIQLGSPPLHEVLELERVRNPTGLAASCVRGVLVGQNNEPAAGLTVTLGLPSRPASAATLNDEGEFCLDIAADQLPGSIYASSGDIDRLQEWSLQLPATEARTNCGKDNNECDNLGPLQSRLLLEDCDGESGVGDGILLLTSGQPEADLALQQLLRDQGYTVTLGPHHTLLESIDLTEFGAVHLRPALDYLGDMPLFAQRALARWVACGGALLTSEWTVWKFATGDFATLQRIHPADASVATGVARSAKSITYSLRAVNPILQAGLPERFAFEADNASGAETWLEPRDGATVFWSSETYGAGVVGWQLNLGRVLSLSTIAGPLELADPNYRQLIANAFAWLLTGRAARAVQAP